MAEYEVKAHSLETFGRVLLSARNHHFVADGPVQNDCPGEALTPAELFLSGVAACGVELMQVIAKQEKLPLTGARLTVSAVIDPAHPVRPDVNLFNSVRLQFQLKGVTQEEGEKLITTFKGR